MYGKKRKNIEAGVLLISALLIISSIVTTTTFADENRTPHTIAGYAYYSSGGNATGATVNVYNSDKNVWLYDIDTVSITGKYSFNVGSPDPGWSDGDTISIYVHQVGTVDHQGWKGNVTDTIDISGGSPQFVRITIGTIGLIHHICFLFQLVTLVLGQVVQVQNLM